MFRIPHLAALAFLSLALILPSQVAAQQKVTLGIPIPFEVPSKPTSFATALPYVKLIHELLDAATTRESNTTLQATLKGSETRSEWIVHRLKADIWVERSSSNYLGQIGAKVSIPCQIEFALDLAAVRHGQMRYDESRRLLIVDLPAVYIRKPIPELSEMKIEPYFKGLRGMLLDSEKMRRLQDELVKVDYLPAARDAALGEHAAAQRKARELMQEFLQTMLRKTGNDIEVVVR